MTARLLSPAWARFWALLLLAVIGLQAATPMRAPLERRQGSAFSAATIDVALSSPRRSESEAAHAQIVSPVASERALAPSPPPPLLVAMFPHLRPDVRGPPPRQRPSRLPDSTAPPLA